MFDRDHPFTKAPAESSNRLSSEPYCDRKAHVASNLYELIHSESSYFDDRDDAQKGQYKESLVDEGNKISGVDDDEENIMVVVVNKTVGLKAAMAKAALLEEDLSSKKKKKTKNGAVINEQDSTGILSQKGNS